MRKEYGKALRDGFAAGIAARAPLYRPWREKSPYVWPGERVFRRMVLPPLACFVVLVPSETGHPAFTVEIGWSASGLLADARQRVIDLAAEPAAFTEDNFICRLSRLWDARIDHWWRFGPDLLDPKGQLENLLAEMRPLSGSAAKATLDPCLRDALDRTIQYGVPYLEAFARSRGAAPG